MAIIDRTLLKSRVRPSFPGRTGPGVATTLDSVDETVAAGAAGQGDKRWVRVKSSPLTRKIVGFNLVALVILVAGILHLNDSYRSLALQRAGALVSDAELIAEVFEARRAAGRVPLSTPLNASLVLDNLSLRGGIEVLVFDTDAHVLGRTQGVGKGFGFGKPSDHLPKPTVLSDALSSGWIYLTGFAAAEPDPLGLEDQLRLMVPEALDNGIQVNTNMSTTGGKVFAAVAPILQSGAPIGGVAVASPSGQIDAFVKAERERVLQMFIVAILVSIGLSLVLASTISNPLAELAAAAELGREKNARKVNLGRIRIPDLTARPDEIGRLSSALRGMVSALYNRIDSNEQFAADVSHEIKNPLASLRSAVGTLRVVQRDDQRDQLLDVIDHDVRRLDRLVSDISNASRLDSELVKEEEEAFDLLRMLQTLNQYLGEDARGRGIDYITDMPDGPLVLQGLEPRLAQVFVNLISNAISFCTAGDAIRVWVRKRENRVIVAVEDTGPGIPDEALGKVFKRFYSQRPEEHFGNNSGLGLAISKQIVEAHGGVIWAENIRPTEADITSEPLGARFLVGLPI